MELEALCKRLKEEGDLHNFKILNICFEDFWILQTKLKKTYTCTFKYEVAFYLYNVI
jgi:hypothetical protein